MVLFLSHLNTDRMTAWKDKHYRDVAQFGRAPSSGLGGREFKSRHSDLVLSSSLV